MKIPIIAILLLFILIMSGTIVSSASLVPGVVVGDYFYYNMYGVCSSNRSNLTIAIPAFEYNTTEWTRITITGVLGTIINQTYTLRFTNGSETSFGFKTDVNPDNQSYLKAPEKAVPICATNLNPGDLVPTVPLSINETVTSTYGRGLRETNHITWNSSIETGNMYFDKETGMLVKLIRTHEFINNVTGEIVAKTDVVNLINTNRWQVSSDKQNIEPLLIIVTILALTLSFFLVSRMIVKKTCKKMTAN